METKFKKRLLAGLTVCGASLLVACRNDNTAEEVDVDEIEVGEVAMEDYSVGDTFVAQGEEPLEIDILYRDHPNYPLREDWEFFQLLEENHNVTFTFTSVPDSDYAERRSVQIAGGDAPSIMTNTWGGDEAEFWSSGAILPISQYTELMPHFSQRVEEWGFEDELDNMRQLDGNYYRLPGLQELVRHEYSLVINQTVFDEHGIETPNTWDEVREALEVLQEAEGGTPYADRWEGQSLLNWASHSFGTIGGWGYGDGVQFDEEADEFVFAPIQDEYRSMLEYFGGLVNDGLMDPESFTGDDEQQMDKFVNLDSFVISGSDQTLIQMRDSMNEVYGEGEYELTLITPPEGPYGPYVGGDRFGNGVMFANSIADRDDFVAILQFWDWLVYSDEGIEFGYWGIEGEHHEKTDEVAGGYRPLDPIDYLGLNPSGTEHLQEDYGFRNGVFAYDGPEHILFSVMDEATIEFIETVDAEREVVEPAPPYPMDQAESEQLSIYRNNLDDITSEWTLRFITGQRDINEDWDTFVNEIQEAGVDNYLETINNAYREFQDTLEEVE
jgi:putative aldouronate transport system substrate-binding protein